jgi:hypothetical protein
MKRLLLTFPVRRFRFLSSIVGTVMAALWMVIAACEGQTPAKTPPVSPPKPLKKSICYFGDTIAYRPGGKKLGGIKTLVRLRWRPKEDKIVEDIVNLDPRPGAPNRFQTLHIHAQGDGFTLNEVNGALQGKGRFLGTNSPWRRWKYKAKLKKGGMLKADVTLGPQKLSEKKTLFNESGEETVSFRMHLRVISDSKCQEFWKQAKGRAFLSKKNKGKKSIPPSPHPPQPSSK